MSVCRHPLQMLWAIIFIAAAHKPIRVSLYAYHIPAYYFCKWFTTSISNRNIFVCVQQLLKPQQLPYQVKLYTVTRCEVSCTRCLKEPHRPHLFHEGVSLTSKCARSCLQDDQGVASVLISGGSENVCLRQAHGAVLFGWFSLFDLDIISTTVFLAQIGYGWRGWIISVLWRRNGGVLGSLKFTAVGRGGIMMEGLAP